MDYKERLEEAKRLYETANADQRYVLESLFPELKESEDERIRKALLYVISKCEEEVFNRVCAASQKECITWLKKQGEQKSQRMISAEAKEAMYDKPAWSEEDEVKINRIVCCLENLNVADNDILLKDVDWLKSLKDRYTWKPSAAQMASITCAVRKMKESACYDSELVSLLNDLKKLKGE